MAHKDLIAMSIGELKSLAVDLSAKFHVHAESMGAMHEPNHDLREVIKQLLELGVSEEEVNEIAGS